MRIFKYIGKFIVFFIKQIFASLIFIGIFISLIIFVLGFFIRKEEVKPVPTIEKNTFINISLPQGVKEANSFEMFSKENKMTMFDLLRAIDFASKDNRIGGIYLDLDKINLSFSQIEEFQSALLNFKNSNKKIISYSYSLNKNNFLLGSISDKLYMNPASATDFSLEGFSISIPYSKKFTDKIGVEFQIIHIGDFKTYGENYVKDEISDEFKKSYEKILEFRANYFIENTSHNRGFSPEIFKENYLNGAYLLQNSQWALDNNFIDGTISFDKLFETENIKNRIDLQNYYSSIKKSTFSDKIAVIIAEGDISDNESSDNINPSFIEEQFKKALADRNVKGIVLRINSSGGSALASEIIHQKLLEVKEKKPVYISISDIAASGGYYIAAAGNKIFANRNSITGSIGVVTMSFNLKNLYEKLGLKFENLEIGKNLDFSDLNQSTDPQELELIKQSMISIYEEFKERVGNGRKLHLDTVETLAKGQIYTGEEAKENKLIDEIGGLNETINQLAIDMNIRNYEIISYKREYKRWNEMLNFRNYLFNKTFLKEMNNLEKNIEFFKELNNRPSLYLPYETN